MILDDRGGLSRIILAKLKVVQLGLEEISVSLFDEGEIDLYLLNEVCKKGVLLLIVDHIGIFAVYHEPG